MKSGLKKALKIGGGTFAGAFVLIGALHMPFAKPLLMKISGCPIHVASATEVDSAQTAAFAKDRGTTPAPARDALGFTLDKTTADDVKAWAASHTVTCHEMSEGTVLRCENVAAALIGEVGSDVEEVQFDFRLKEKTLRIVSTFRGGFSRAEAATVLGQIDTKLKQDLGAPSKEAGDPQLATGAPRGHLVSYNFADYRADASGSDLGPHGYGIREHYVSTN